MSTELLPYKQTWKTMYVYGINVHCVILFVFFDKTMMRSIINTINYLVSVL